MITHAFNSFNLPACFPRDAFCPYSTSFVNRPVTLPCPKQSIQKSNGVLLRSLPFLHSENTSQQLRKEGNMLAEKIDPHRDAAVAAKHENTHELMHDAYMVAETRRRALIVMLLLQRSMRTKRSTQIHRYDCCREASLSSRSYFTARAATAAADSSLHQYKKLPCSMT